MRFLLVDRIHGPTTTGGFAGSKVVALSDDVLEHHFPGRPILPGVLLLEALTQLAGWAEAHATDYRDWFLLDRVERCAFYGFVLPGDRVELVVDPLPAAEGWRRWRGTGTVDGERRVAAEIEGPVGALAELEDPAASRRLLAHLKRETSW